MNYIQLLLTLCVLAQASTSYSMHKEKIKKALKFGGTSIFFGVTLGSSWNDTKNTFISDNKSIEAHPDVKQFIQETLQEAEYSEPLYTSIKIKKGRKFMTCFNSIYVPFSEHDLKNAQLLAKKKSVRDSYSLYQHTLLLKELYKALPQHLPNDIKKTILMPKGIPTDKHSLTHWKNSIIHEGGHIAHDDALTAIILSTVLPFGVHFGTKKIPLLHFLPMRLLVHSALFNLLDLAVGKYNEYQADQEIIKRVKDPKALEIRSRHFKNSHQLNELENEQKLKELHQRITETEKIILTLCTSYIEILENQQAHKNYPNTMLNDLQKLTENTLEQTIILHQTRETVYNNLIQKSAFYKKYPLLQEFKQYHPTNLVRSAYFKKAAEQLRIKEQK